jgi:peroxiredoxin
VIYQKRKDGFMEKNGSPTNKLKIVLGQSAPDFELRNTQDNPVNLSDFQGKKNIVLAMNRSFVCPFCRRHMAELRHDYQKFVDRDTEVIVIGPNDVDSFKRTWKMEDMPMVGLADPGSRVANIYQQEVNLFKLGRMPAIFVIDRQGIIRFMHYSKFMSDIPDNKIILSVLDSINT